MRPALSQISAAALILLLSACDIQDISPLLEIYSNDETGGAVWQQPYLGQLGVSWRLKPDPTSEHTAEAMELRWQARTSGFPEADACLAIDRASGNALTLKPNFIDDSSADFNPATISLRAGTRRLDGQRQSDDPPLALNLTSNARQRWLITITGMDEMPTLEAHTGTTVQLIERDTEHEACDGAQRFEFTVEAGNYRLLFDQKQISGTLHIERPCEEERTVPATCPGYAGAVVLAVARSDEPDTMSGWVSPAELGPGDLLASSISCDSQTGCGVVLEQTITLEPLACRSNGDCNQGGSCTQDGLCSAGGGCAAAPGPLSPGGAILALLALLWAWRGRTRGRPGSTPSELGVRGALLGALTLALLPNTAQALELPRLSDTREVSLSVSAGQRRLLGRGSDELSPALSLNIGQGLQFGRVGFFLSAGLDSALINSAAPPAERGIQLSAFALTARTAIQWYQFQLLAGPSWLRISPLVNSAPRLLGSRRAHHGFGAYLTLRAEHLKPLFFEVALDTHVLVTTPKPLQTFSWGIQIGLAESF